jgi:hypothetical protein
LSFALALVVLWVRSYSMLDEICWGRHGRLYWIVSGQGVLSVQLVVEPSIEGMPLIVRRRLLSSQAWPEEPDISDGRGSWMKLCNGKWYRVGLWTNNRFVLDYGTRIERIGSGSIYHLGLPYDVLVVLAVSPLPFVVLRLLRTYHRLCRRKLGLCPTCGYDLRATPDRCPECGSAVPPRASPDPPVKEC